MMYLNIAIQKAVCQKSHLPVVCLVSRYSYLVKHTNLEIVAIDGFSFFQFLNANHECIMAKQVASVCTRQHGFHLGNNHWAKSARSKQSFAHCLAVVENLLMVLWVVGSIPCAGPIEVVVCAILSVGWCK